MRFTGGNVTDNIDRVQMPGRLHEAGRKMKWRKLIMATRSSCAAAFGRQCDDLAATQLCTFMFILVLVVSFGGILPVLGDTSFSFFNFSNWTALNKFGDVQMANGALLLNSGAANTRPGLATAGRVVYMNPVEFYDNVTKSFGSFYTAATLSIRTGQDNCWGADGMAFIIFSESSPGYSGTETGGYLGILNNTTNNGLASNQILAVEIDTWQNSYFTSDPEFNDPSACHMAVLKNSMTHDPASTSDYCQGYNSSWCLNNCIQDSSLTSSYVLEVQYDGAYLYASLTTVNSSYVIFGITQKLDLTTVFDTNKLPQLYVGFSGSTHNSCAETHRIYSWSFEALSPVSSTGQSPVASPPLPQVTTSISPRAAAGPATRDNKKESSPSPTNAKRTAIVAGSLGAMGALLAVGGAFLAVCLTRRLLKFRPGNNSSSVSGRHMLKDSDALTELQLPAGVSLHGLRRFTYQELSSATNKFAPEDLLGRGGFGSVYKGKLVDTGALVAVKMISPEKFQHGGEKEFLSEVSIISRVHHRNLVKLQGCCYDRSNMLLVYDHMANGSLDRLLIRKKTSIISITTITSEELSILKDTSSFIPTEDHLTWDIRFKIVNAIAGSLSYLHGECGQCILHRDVKPSNVLLDSEFNAYLADFGLARLFDHDKMAPTMTCGGTPGYIAPEIFQYGRFTTKSDVYSFGVLALEVACGRRPIEPQLSASEVILLDWVWAAHEAEDLLSVVDPCLGSEYDESEMRRLLQVGLLCCIVDPEERVSMMAARNILAGTNPIPDLPETKPEVHYRTRRKSDPKSFITEGSRSSTTECSSGTGNSVSSLSQTEAITDRLGPR